MKPTEGTSFIRSAVLDGLLRHKKKVYFILGLPIFSIVIYFLFHHYISSFFYISWSRTHLVGVPLLELVLLFSLYDIYHGSKKQESWFVGVFIFSFLNFIIVYFLMRYYNTPAFQNVFSVKVALSLAWVVLVVLFIAMIVFFLMGFKKQLVNLWFYHSFNSEKETTSEKRKTNISIISLLLAFFVLGLSLRLYNLDGFPPYVDEYIHTNRAFLMYIGQSVEWGRAYITVNIPVYLSYLAFGISMWAGRVPMVFINMLSIFPLYILGRKVNQGVGFLSVALFTFSPWIIASSRTVRDYAVAPLLFYTAAALLINLLEWEGLSITEYIQKNKYRILLTGLIFGYAIIDKTSIVRIVLACYGVFGVLVILKILKQDIPRHYKLLILLLGSAPMFFLLSQTRILYRYLNSGAVSYQMVPTYWATIVSSNLHQWYTIGEIGYVILFVGGFLAVRSFSRSYHRPDFVVLFFFLTFLSHLSYLTYFLATPRIPGRMRYGILMEYWYLPLVALFIWFLYDLIRKASSSLRSGFLILLLALLFFNPYSIWYVLSYKSGDRLQITGENHYIVNPAHDFLAANLTEQDVLLSDFVHSYDNINGRKFRSQTIISYYGLIFSNNISPLTIIEDYPQGWIAVSLNARPARNNLVFEDFIHAGKHVRYVGNKGDIYLWQWKEKINR